jgi:hypothetical protein
MLCNGLSTDKLISYSLQHTASANDRATEVVKLCIGDVVGEDTLVVLLVVLLLMVVLVVVTVAALVVVSVVPLQDVKSAAGQCSKGASLSTTAGRVHVWWKMQGLLCQKKNIAFSS